MAKRTMTPGQITVILPPDQLERVDAIVAARQKKTPFLKRMDVIREVFTLGLERVKT
jgi:hypothetical protein